MVVGPGRGLPHAATLRRESAFEDGTGLTFRELLALYWRLVGARARSQMQYKVSFAILIAGNVAATLSDFAAIVIIFGRIPHLAGWSFGEVAMIYGLSLACFGLAETFVPGFDTFHRLIVQGTFDRVLTRPLGAFFQILASDLALRKLARVAQGLVIFYVAQRLLPVQWTPDKLLVVALAIPSGALIFVCVFVLGAASIFWTVQANEVVNAFTHGGVTLLSYPLDIYHIWLQRFVTFVVPLAFVSYYPALYLLDRSDPLGLPRWVGLLSPVAAGAFVALAWLGWSLGVRHYESVGN